MIRVCITDDHKMVLEGLELLLHEKDVIEIVLLCHSAVELLECLKTHSIDVILLDINMPEMNGIEATKTIKKAHADVKILGLSMIAENNLIKLMLKNGADGYLYKNAGKSEIVEAIHQVYQGKTYISQEITQILIGHTNPIQTSNLPFPRLSSRELQILKLIMDEKTTQEIANELFISFGTVETHRRNIMSKLNVKNLAGLVRVAIEYNILS